MKVKHFIADNGEVCSFDDEINNFIQGRKIIDIKYSSCGYGYVTETTIDNVRLYTALVMYEE